MSEDFCRHCGHHISDHEPGFFNPCRVCGKDEDGYERCIDFEPDEPDPDEEEGEDSGAGDEDEGDDYEPMPGSIFDGGR